MQLPPGLRSFLDKMGVNTTRLQWRLYEWERRRARIRERGVQLPVGLRWLQYPHKRCFGCRAINDRSAKTCHACGRRIPPMPVYRTLRFVGVLLPEEARPVSSLFLGVIIVLYGLSLMMDGLGGLLMPSGPVMAAFGAYSPAVTFIPQEAWRIFGSALVHLGIIHIGFNAMALVQIGPLVETQVGRNQMIAIMTLTQLASNVGTFVWYGMLLGAPYVSTVGASGILFGLIGYGLMYFRLQGGGGAQYSRQLIQWAVYALILSYFIGANNAAHIGGLIGGVLLAYVPLHDPRRPGWWERIWTGACAVSVAVWFVTFAFLGHSVLTADLGQAP